MKTKASFMHHPIHPMIIVFPLGLWIFSFICQIIFKLSNAPVWHEVALYTMCGGIIGAALAAVPGLIDLFDLPKSKARTIGIWHMLTNVTVLTIFIIAFFIDIYSHEDEVAFVLSLVGVALLLLGGWLGGELVYRYAIGVAEHPANQSKI